MGSGEGCPLPSRLGRLEEGREFPHQWDPGEATAANAYSKRQNASRRNKKIIFS